jgi:beta-glucosidase
MDVAFPFGHGLSYTTFAYGDAAAAMTADGDLEVRVTVANTGDRAGREVVQVYTSLPGGQVQRPQRELKAFASLALEAGESREVVLTVRRKDLAYWDVRIDGWVVEGGEYVVDVAASSRDIRSSVPVEIEADDVVVPLSRTSSIGEVMAHPVVGQMVQAAIAQMMSGMDGVEAIMPEGVDASKMMESFPIGRAGMFAAGDSGGAINPEMIDGLIAMANAPRQ